MRLVPLPPSAWIALVACLLVGCASSPPPQLYHLRATPVPARAAAFAGTLALSPVQLPDYLDRSALLVREGAAGLKALDSHRWAEPLAGATTRVLRDNLAARLGEARVWLAPLPTGLRASRSLRVELQRFEADADARTLRLSARWVWLDLQAGPNGAPRVQARTFDQPIAAPTPDAIAAAHALALDALAEAIASSLDTP